MIEEENSREEFESDKNETEKCVVAWLTSLNDTDKSKNLIRKMLSSVTVIYSPGKKLQARPGKDC